MISKIKSFKALSTLMLFQLVVFNANAQGVADTLPGNSWLTTILIGIVVFSLIWTVTVIRKAVVVLKENGKEVDFLSTSFFRALTFSPVLITTSIVILLAAAIYLAVNY